jgi:hypothetical protein
MPKAHSMYNVRLGKNPGAYVVHKVSEDFEPLDTYYISESSGGGLTCTCPAHKPWCRHMDVLRKFQAEERVNTTWHYIFDTKTWIPPLTLNP